MAGSTFVLWINPGPVPPPEGPEMRQFYYFDPALQSDVLQPCWGDREKNAPGRFEQPNVRYHFTYSTRLREPVKLAWELAFFVREGLRIHRSDRCFRAIVTYGTTRTGFAGLLLKCLTGARLIVKIAGDPRTAYLADSEQPSVADRLKHRLARAWTRFLLRRVDRLVILFPGQMDVFPEAAAVPQTVCPEFTPISRIQPSTADGRYVLFLGFPWHLKGVDVLIRAFNQVCGEYPGYRLKIVGHCPDRAPFEALRAGNDRIEFYKGVKHAEALALIAGCTCLVLPSRTEAMGRVLLEAMAAGKPVIASRVGGIPHYVTDGETGLLFESESVDALASCLRRILGEPDLRERLAARGFQHAHEGLSEREYARTFSELVAQTIGQVDERRSPARAPHGE